jgi:hypothetical protein
MQALILAAVLAVWEFAHAAASERPRRGGGDSKFAAAVPDRRVVTNAGDTPAG